MRALRQRGCSSDEVERLIQERRATVGFRAAIESREIIIPDLGRQAGAPESVFARPSVAYAAVFAVPLRLREAALGSMVFTYPEPKVPSESELDLARTFASHAAIAIH
ncbi:MAG: GAF domain-containing protein, partial [Nitrospinota bacterium]